MGPMASLAAQHRAPGPEPAPQRRIHYGWWIVAAAVLSVFVSLGVGRFALGMLLPAMGDGLALSDVQMGWISTTNFIGYLLGALWVRRLLPRFGERRLIAMAMMAIVASMVGVSIASGFYPLLFLYAGTGIGSGIAFVCTAALVPHWFVIKWRGRALGLLSAGAGMAIMLSGWAIPLINDATGPMGWRLGWGGLAAVSLPLALFCLFVVRNRPADLGLLPFGAPPGRTLAQSEARSARRYATTHTTAKAPVGAAARAAAALAKVAFRNLLISLGAVYFLFGMTYVVYGTFVVTSLVREHGMAEARAGQFWVWMGFFTLFCGPLLGALSDRMGRRAGIATAFLLQGCAYTLIAWGEGNGALYLSVALFGLSAFGVPLILTASVADYLTPERAVGALGGLTVVFGLGQTLGPILAALMAEHSGGFTPAYLAATSLVSLAIAITLTLPDPPK